MAVKIRLKRMGKTHAPFYRIVVADSRTKRDGRAIEEIGKYDPLTEPSTIEVNSPRAQYWLGVGAQPSDQVLAILKITGDWQTFKGLPGTEGTLRTAAPKADKQALYEAAAKESADDTAAAGATTPKSKKKADAKPTQAAAEATSEASKDEPVAEVEANDAGEASEQTQADTTGAEAEQA